VVAYQTIIVEELLKCGKQITINGKDYATCRRIVETAAISLDLCPKLPNWDGTSAVAGAECSLGSLNLKAPGFAGIFTRQPSRRRFIVSNLARTPRRERHWAEAFNEFSRRYLFEMRPCFAAIKSAW